MGDAIYIYLGFEGNGEREEEVLISKSRGTLFLHHSLSINGYHSIPSNIPISHPVKQHQKVRRELTSDTQKKSSKSLYVKPIPFYHTPFQFYLTYSSYHQLSFLPSLLTNIMIEWDIGQGKREGME